jgi:integrase
MAEGKAVSHKDQDSLDESHSKSGEFTRVREPQQQPTQPCPQCGSVRLYRDGIRYLASGDDVQRLLCKECGFRFSDPVAKAKSLRLLKNKSGNGKYADSYPKNLLRAIALTDAETRRDAAQRESTAETADAKGKIVEFAWWLQKQNCKSAKNRFNMLKRLTDLRANLEDPESVKSLLAQRQDWTDSYKMLLTYAYESYLKMEGRTWQRPTYKQTKTMPFIPTEEELDQLINGSGKKLGTFLQGLKDTGCDPGELAKLKWKDLNAEAKTVNVTPVKGHKPRTLRVSDQFLNRIQTLPRNSEYVFNYESLRRAFGKARKFLSRKLSNPRLTAISFTTFRHWKGTMEYHRTHDILHVKELLGHMRIDNTMVYINLENAVFASKSDQFYAAVATERDQAVKLVEAGFEYVTGEYNDGGKIFKKRK